MALTGRAALLAAIGSLPVGIVAPSWTGMLAVNAPISLAILCDYALAAPVRSLQFTRSGDTSVRLGDGAEVQLTVTNPSRRRLRAHLRDAWPPSSWLPDTEPSASRHTLTVPPGERRRLSTLLRPTRRGDRRAEQITIRSYGPLGLAARQGNHQVPWTIRVLPPFTSRKHLPSRLARLRELDGRTSILARGEGTEFDSLRAYAPVTTSARSTGGPPLVRPQSRFGPGAPSATGTSFSSSIRAVRRQAGSATFHAWTRRWTRRCSSPLSRPVPATASPCSPTAVASGRGFRAVRPGRPLQPWSMRWHRSNRSSWRPMHEVS